MLPLFPSLGLAASCLLLPMTAHADELALTAVPAPAAAPAMGSALAFDTVIVTARKRAEAAQTVPISITAYDQVAIDRLDIRSLADLRFTAPSVYTAPSTFRQDTLNITIRGQRNFESTGLQFDTATAVYVDGVYYARPVGLTGALFDVDSVQVLKGPQGTLVGRNSTGGAILYETRQPTDSFGGFLKLTGGNYGRHELQTAVNLPLGPTLAVRAALSDNELTGYIKNNFRDPATGAVNTTPGMGIRQITGRVSVKWTPDPTFSLLLRGTVAAEHDTGTTYHDLGYFEGTVLATGAKPSICNIPGTCAGFTDLLGRNVGSYYTDVTTRAVNPAANTYNSPLNALARENAAGFWSAEQALSNYDVGHYTTLSAVADKTLGGVDVKLTGAYRGWDTKGISSSRGLGYVTNVFTYGTPDYKSYQSELTVNGTSFKSRLKWTGGLFFFRETSPNDGDQLYLFLPAGVTPTAAAGKQITYTNPTNNDERNTSYAAYAQGTYDLGANTRFTTGLRYTVDERFAHLATQTVRTPATAATTATVANGIFNPASFTILGTSYVGQTDACALTNSNGVLLPLAQCSIDLDRHFRRPTWTLALDHDLTEHTLVYATARSGYRSGAINSGAINPNVIVAKPEDVNDYEVGIKSDWSVGGVPVRTNLAAYSTAYRNIQIQTSLPNVTIASGPGGTACTQAVFNAGQCVGSTNDNVTLNARAARIRGFEWELTARPVPELTLGLSGSYLDAVYTDYTFSPPNGYLLPTGQTNLSGTPFPLPKWQTTATAAYTIAAQKLGTTAFDEMVLSARGYWQSHYMADQRPYNPVQHTTAYTLVNLRLDIAGIAGRKIDFSVFADNVFNRKACLPESQGVLGSAPQGSFGVAGTSGLLQCLPLAPRMAGASLQHRF
jgi:iron complex outermembrane receptor protein